MDFAASRREQLDSLRRIAWSWSAVLQAHAERERLDDQYAGCRFTTFGFIPASTEIPAGLPTKGGYVFGIAIELGPHQDESPGQAMRTVEVQGQVFALALNQRSYDLDLHHPLSPKIGSGACWARSNRTMPPGVSAEGVLTAEHVISGTSLGGTVTMTSGGTWHLADSGDCKIDAALVTQAGVIPPLTPPLAVQRSPSPNTKIDILGNASAPTVVTGTITHTMIFPTYLSERSPMRVFLDVHGIGGDSGALVRDQSTKEGIAIYMGKTRAPQTAPGGGTVEGICQYLEQARAALNVSLSL